jgi:hypothetical protein
MIIPVPNLLMGLNRENEQKNLMFTTVQKNLQSHGHVVGLEHIYLLSHKWSFPVIFGAIKFWLEDLSPITKVHNTNASKACYFEQQNLFIIYLFNL